MREGIYWRAHHRALHHQGDDDDPVENLSLFSRLEGRRRASKFLVLCIILCFLTWTTLKTLRSPHFIFTERQLHQMATNGIVFELFKYHRSPQGCNRTFAINTNTIHQRRRSLVLDEKNLVSQSRQLMKSATHGTHDDDEYEMQLFDEEGDGFYLSSQSLKKRMESPNSLEKQNVPIKDSLVEEAPTTGENSKIVEAEGRWPLQGGIRETDLDIQNFYIKAQIGYGSKSIEYFLHIDTGSGITWLMCKGRGPITSVGPNGLFRPDRESFLDCRNKDLCSAFQEGSKYPCNEKRRFKCEFDYEFGDGLDISGHITMGDISFELNDGSQSHVQIAFGCADKVHDEDTKAKGQSTQLTDGLIGLGPHKASLVQQLYTLGHISNQIVGICFEPDIQDNGKKQGPLVSPSAGFLTLGNSYESQVGNIIWTNNIPVQAEDGELESIYTARLMEIHYRTKVIHLQEPIIKNKKKGFHPSRVIQGVRMGFDSGSDLTYLTSKIYNDVVQVLNNEAGLKGYERAKDSNEFVKHEQRVCWANRGERIAITEFGDLTLVFQSLSNDDIPPAMVIEPQYYITSRGSRKHPRTCFNMLKEVDFDYGNIGAELMKGHLFLFDSHINRIGWRPTASCKDLR